MVLIIHYSMYNPLLMYIYSNVIFQFFSRRTSNRQLTTQISILRENLLGTRTSWGNLRNALASSRQRSEFRTQKLVHGFRGRVQFIATVPVDSYVHLLNLIWFNLFIPFLSAQIIPQGCRGKYDKQMFWNFLLNLILKKKIQFIQISLFINVVDITCVTYLPQY